MTKNGQDAQEPVDDDGHWPGDEAAHNLDEVRSEACREEEQEEAMAEQEFVEEREQVVAQEGASERKERVVEPAEESGEERQVSLKAEPQSVQETDSRAIEHEGAETISTVPANLEQNSGGEESPMPMDIGDAEAEVAKDDIQPGSVSPGEDVDENANIEMPAIAKALTSTQEEKGDNRYGVEEVLGELPSWQEDSQLLRANYPTTTAYRVAIKKRRYTTLGNTIFLVFCALILLGVTSVFFLYFSHSIASDGPGARSTARPAQPTSAVAVSLAGAETTAPRASSSILSGYQWIQAGTKHDLYIGTNDHIQELATSDGQNWQITDLTRRSGAAVPNGRTLAGFEWQHGNTEQLVYIDAKQHVQQLYSSDGSQWNVVDLTRKAQAPLANGNAIAGYEWSQDGSEQVVYTDLNGDIQELSSSDNSTWRVADLTTLAKAPRSNRRVISAYQWDSQGSKQVDYIDTKQHIQELSFVEGSWRVSDLTALVSAPPANGGTLTSYEWRQAGSRQIAYLDTNKHVQLLTSTGTSNWSLLDLTLLSKAPLANGNTLVGYEWQQGGRSVLYFVDNNGHIQELSDAPGEKWQLTDLNQGVQGAPSSNGKLISGYDWAQRGSKQVIYIDLTGTVRELTSSNEPGKWKLSRWKRS